MTLNPKISCGIVSMSVGGGGEENVGVAWGRGYMVAPHLAFWSDSKGQPHPGLHCYTPTQPLCGCVVLDEAISGLSGSKGQSHPSLHTGTLHSCYTS